MNKDIFDAIYFLMFPGWENEMRSNRWHFISRWAHYAPVVIIQPVQNFPSAQSDTVIEDRISNARVLRIQSVRPSPFFDRTTHLDIQLAQVEQDMLRHQVRRPLLWAYNPELSDLYTRLPAAYRVFHATEDYFLFKGPEQGFIPQLLTCINLSDLVVAVSDGVAKSIADNATPRKLRVETNGCDFVFYANHEATQNPLGLRRLGRRVAIYAGNINWRLDFALILRTCATISETQFVFFGPMADLTENDLRSWRQLLKTSNFHYLGAATPEQLRKLYAEADLGIIPYLATSMISESGFPLKALEMGASGLPVVSTLMKPLRHLAEALVVTTTSEEFVSAASSVDRQSLSRSQCMELTAIARRESYDEKFLRIRSSIAADCAEHDHVSRHTVSEPNTARRGSEIDSLLSHHSQHRRWLFGIYALLIAIYRTMRRLRSRARMGPPRTFDPADLRP